jgi:PA domain
MKNFTFISKSLAVVLAAVLYVVCASSAFANATVVVINNDGPGEGFNDPTPAAPVGGNPGTTKGAQRLFAFQFAADKWGATLDSNQTIRVLAAFNPLATNVLGSAGAWDLFADFPGAGLHPGPEFTGTWYNSALADMRAGTDLDPTSPDINAQFSSNFDFYLGVDNNHGAQNDLVAVLLHELGHGMGFQTFVNKLTGKYFTDPSDPVRYPPLPDIYSRHLFDNTQNLAWTDMTDEQRRVSIFNWGNLVWHGTNVHNDIPQVLVFGSPQVQILSPAAIAGVRQFGTAAFGPALSSPGVMSNIVAAVDPADAVGAATTDGCSPFTNAAAVAGHIALVERGTCGFALKARNATNAGAIGVIIYNNAANVNAAPPGMADNGVDGAFVTIPAVSLTRADGLNIVAQLGVGVNALMNVDLNIRAGADANGNARLYAPFPVATGSNVSHYDTVANKNLLMEPAINPDLTHELSAPNDLTLELMRDIGWFPDTDVDGEPNSSDCEPHSDLSPTVVIGGCDSGVANRMFTVAPNRGCTLADRIAHVPAGNNRGEYLKNVQALLNALKKSGAITAAEKDALSSCAAQSQ